MRSHSAYTEKVLADKRMLNALESIQNESKMHRPGVAKDALNQLLTNVGNETQSKTERLAARVASLEAPITRYQNIVNGLEVCCIAAIFSAMAVFNASRRREVSQSRSFLSTLIVPSAYAIIYSWRRRAFTIKLKSSQNTLFSASMDLNIFVYLLQIVLRLYKQ